MIRALIMVLLVALSRNAAAEWIKLGDSTNKTFYADPESIRKVGDMVKMWDLLDYQSVPINYQGKSILSAKSQNEYNCKDGESRMLYYSFHSANMGGGVTIVSYSHPNEWEPVAPGSLIMTLWKFACRQQ